LTLRNSPLELHQNYYLLVSLSVLESLSRQKNLSQTIACDYKQLDVVLNFDSKEFTVRASLKLISLGQFECIGKFTLWNIF